MTHPFFTFGFHSFRLVKKWTKRKANMCIDLMSFKQSTKKKKEIYIHTYIYCVYLNRPGNGIPKRSCKTDCMPADIHAQPTEEKNKYIYFSFCNEPLNMWICVVYCVPFVGYALIHIVALSHIQTHSWINFVRQLFSSIVASFSLLFFFHFFLSFLPFDESKNKIHNITQNPLISIAFYYHNQRNE